MAETIKGINGERIAWCCFDTGISIDELAQATNIPVAKIEQVIGGEPALTFNQLSRVADHFGRGLLFFVQDGPVEVQQFRTPAFRTITNMKPQLSIRLKKLIESAERQRETYESLLEELVDPPQAFAPPEFSQGDIPEAARATRQWLGLNAQSTFLDYRRAIETKGILVFRSNGYAGDWQIAKNSPILGFSIYDEQFPLIVVKKARNEVRETFTLFHELGHILLHEESWIDDAADFASETGEEAEANRFAGLVLIPTDALAPLTRASQPDSFEEYPAWVAPISKRFGVSTEVILRRLLDEGRLSATAYNEYRDWVSESFAEEETDESGGNRGYRHREPIHIFGDRYVRTVLDALGNRKISLVKASKYLDGLKLNDLQTLNRYYADL